MKIPNIKKVVRLSAIYETAREEFEMMKGIPDLDPDFFTDEELEHYVGVIVRSHLNEWIVIDDISNERKV